jgi:isocitrate dehydrogenase (NAD+)
MMLDHLGEVEAGNRVRAAVAQVIELDTVRTRDLGGTATTTEFGDAVVRRIA